MSRISFSSVGCSRAKDGAPGAFLMVQPDDGWPVFLGDGLGNLRSSPARQAHSGGDCGAESQKIAPADVETALDLVKPLRRRWHLSSQHFAIFLLWLDICSFLAAA